jgi:hypothetical protein
MPKTQQWEEDSKVLSAQQKRRIKCKRCGCTRSVRGADNKNVCRNCGYYIFRTDKDEFIYRMRERINYDKRKGNSENNTSKK